MSQPTGEQLKAQIERMKAKRLRNDAIPPEQRSREALSASLMNKRVQRALDVADVEAGDLITRFRIAELEMWGSLYRAKAGEGNPVTEQRAIQAAKAVMQSLAYQAELAGLAKKAGEAPGAETGPGGEQIQALLRHVLRTDPRFEKAYLAAAAGKPWQEVLEGETIEAKRES